jgi:2-oxoacid:acceptor oxidoreductase delta subunit (pyruvate/2-ketoisovalerate family)
VKAKTEKTKKAKVERPKVTTKSVKAKVQKQAPKRSSEARKKIVMPEDMFGTISVPEDRAVPFGAITPAPIKQQELFITSNWRIVRPVIDHEKCTLCLTCYISCPDSCWSFNEQEEKMEWNWKFCKGCQICINECPADALKAVPELDFEDGVVRLEKPF